MAGGRIKRLVFKHGGEWLKERHDPWFGGSNDYISTGVQSGGST